MSNLSIKLDTVLQSLPNDIEGGGVISATSTLLQRANEIRNIRINWSSFSQIGQVISKENFDFIARYDALQTSEERNKFIRENEMLCAESFLNLLFAVSSHQVAQYILILMDDMLNEDKSRVDMFKDYCKKKKQAIWSHLEHQTNNIDPFIVNMALRITSKFACWSKELMEGRDLQQYVHTLRDQMKLPDNEYLQSVARCIQMMLRINEYKLAFVAADGIASITSVLSKQTNFQVQYQLTFCLWLMSFTTNIVEKMSGTDVIPVLSSILKETTKEKVVRIILATFRNLIEKPEDKQISSSNAISMIEWKVLKQLNLLEQGQKLEDEDVKEDVEFLQEKLEASVHDLSSFDQYCNEVKSGRLDWSPVHRNEQFWRENAPRLNEKNYELLKILIKILEISQDPKTLAIAVHDIGEYVRYYARGKAVTENLGGKHLIMQLLNAEDPNLKYEALVCVQKMMVQNWEYLGKQLEKEASKENKPANVKA